MAFDFKMNAGLWGHCFLVRISQAFLNERSVELAENPKELGEES